MITFFQYEFVRIYDAFAEAPKMSTMEVQISLKLPKKAINWSVVMAMKINTEKLVRFKD